MAAILDLWSRNPVVYLLALQTFWALLCLTHVGTSTQVRSKRGSFVSSYSFSDGDNSFSYRPLNIPLQETHLYSLGIESFLPFAEGSSLSLSKGNIAPVALSNSVEKPVQEPSDLVPPQITGTAVIPLRPPPAVSVIAASANVPSNNGAVFLGSGGLGVINLGNGAFALGAGGIAYSNTRQQPRPNGRSPLFPPLPASPNLVPAATPSQQSAQLPQIPQVDPMSQQVSPNGYQFNQPLFNPSAVQPQVDQNGYERLQPNSVSFGMATARVRPIKTRMNFATFTVPQVTADAGENSQLPQSGFGVPIPRLPAQALKYV